MMEITQEQIDAQRQIVETLYNAKEDADRAFERQNAILNHMTNLEAQRNCLHEMRVYEEGLELFREQLRIKLLLDTVANAKTLDKLYLEYLGAGAEDSWFADYKTEQDEN